MNSDRGGIEVIFNAAAGRADLESIDRWARRRSDVRLVAVGESATGRQLAHQAVARGARLIVAAGGDGTVHEVANGLASQHSQAVLGIIPLGTGNDAARSLGIPLDVADALSLLESSASRSVDLICLSGPQQQFVVNTAAGGFGVQVEENVTGQAKALLGPFAYWLAAARSARQAREYLATITLDNEAPFTVETPNIVLANGRWIGGGNEIAPQARVDDGRMDVVIVTAQSLLRRLKVAVEVGTGSHLDSEDVIFRRAARVRIESDPPMPFSLDGENFEGDGAIEFAALPRALHVIAPSPPADSQPTAREV